MNTLLFFANSQEIFLRTTKILLLVFTYATFVLEYSIKYYQVTVGNNTNCEDKSSNVEVRNADVKTARESGKEKTYAEAVKSKNSKEVKHEKNESNDEEERKLFLLNRNNSDCCDR